MRSGLYGMTNGNVRVLFVGGLSASSCDRVYDEAFVMCGRISLSL